MAKSSKCLHASWFNNSAPRHVIAMSVMTPVVLMQLESNPRLLSHSHATAVLNNVLRGMHSTEVAYLLLTSSPWFHSQLSQNNFRGKIIDVAEVNQ